MWLTHREPAMKTVIEFAQQLLDPSPLGAVTLIALAALTVAYRALERRK